MTLYCSFSPVAVNGYGCIRLSYTHLHCASKMSVWNAPCMYVYVSADFKHVGSFSLCRKPDRVTHYKRTQLLSQSVPIDSSSVCTFNVYVGRQWRDFFILYLCELIPCHVVGQAWWNVNLTVGICVYHDSHCDIQSWARAAHHYCSAYVDSVF